MAAPLPFIDFGSVEEFMAGLNAWVAIESPTASAEAVNRMVNKAEADFAAIGVPTIRHPGTNGRGDHLVARAPWGDPDAAGVLVVCHLDTVHPIGNIAINPIREVDGRAYGPGIQDMKSGGYMALTALRRLIEAGHTTPLPVTIVYVSDEEVGSGTSRALIEQLASQSRYALVLEPARDGGKIVTARKGVGRFEIEVRGRPSHSGNAHAKGRSAIRELAAQVLALEAMTDYERGITVNIGQIEGGTAGNVVPEFARASIDLRVPSDDTGREMTERILRLKPQFPDTEVRITGGLNRAPYRKNDRQDIAVLFDTAARIAAGLGFTLEDLPDGEGSGGSDGQFCVAYVPVLDGLGPCGAGLHTNDEYIDLESIRPRGNLLLRLLQTLA